MFIALGSKSMHKYSIQCLNVCILRVQINSFWQGNTSWWYYPGWGGQPLQQNEDNSANHPSCFRASPRWSPFPIWVVGSDAQKGVSLRLKKNSRVYQIGQRPILQSGPSQRTCLPNPCDVCTPVQSWDMDGDPKWHPSIFDEMLYKESLCETNSGTLTFYKEPVSSRW